MMLRTMMPRTRLEWVEKLAGAGMWIAIGASFYVESTRPEWTWVAASCICIMTLAAGRRSAALRGGKVRPTDQDPCGTRHGDPHPGRSRKRSTAQATGAGSGSMAAPAIVIAGPHLG
jgi:hypothetical protein